MPVYSLKPREIPYDDRYDVIVAGGGPAGCAAAIAAAREGKKTLLIEATGCLGGMGTSGLVPAWGSFSDQERLIYTGIGVKIMEAVKTTMPHVPESSVDGVPIDPEMLKTVYDTMVSESGADVLFGTLLSGVETDGNGRVAAVILSNKEGLSAYSAKVYIDCTGDGDLAVWAGAPYEKGDETTGEMQPATHCFTLSNVDSYAYQFGPRLHPSNPDSPVFKIRASEKYPLIHDFFMCNNFIGPDTVGFNAGHVFCADNTNPHTLSMDMMTGRKLARQLRDALAEFFPAAFAGAFLVQTGSLMGIRETRRIMGDYKVTREDYLERRNFEDEICLSCYPMDLHSFKAVVEGFVGDILEGKYSFGDMVKERGKQYRHYGKGDSHGVPYRALLPQGLTNVLVAGRCVSSDRSANGSLRVMPVCLAMGEAAGMAAAMAADVGGDVRGFDVQLLRSKLREAGAYLP